MKLFSRIFIVLGALFFLQLPLFINAYTQQMVGRVAELRLQKEALLKIAQQSGKTLDQYVYKFLNSTDADFHGQGEWMQASLNRLQSLTEALTSLQNATLWQKPFIFLKTINLEIGKATLNHFEPGLPLTLEGALYVLFGAGLGWLVFFAFRQLFRALMSPFRKQKEAPGA